MTFKPEVVLEVPVGRIHPNSRQPRQHFDIASLRSLAVTIEKDGQAVPVLLRAHPKNAGHYELIAGERRWRAVRDYCLKVRTLKAIVLSERDDAKAFRVSFVENEHREDLHPLERAEAMKRLMDDGATQVQIAEMVGRSATYVSHHLALLTLHPDAKKLLDPAIPERRRLTFSAAVTISRAPREKQPALAAAAVRKDTRLADVKERVEKLVDARGGRQRGRPRNGRQSLWIGLQGVERILRTRFASPEAIEALYAEEAAAKDAAATAQAARRISKSLSDLADRLEKVRKVRAA